MCNARKKWVYQAMTFAAVMVILLVIRVQTASAVVKFAPPTYIPNATETNALMLAGDFNKDGNMDVVSGGKSGYSILMGDGTGNFTKHVYKLTDDTYFPKYYASGIASGDFNKDGNLDLAMTYQSLNNMKLFIGNGDGTFTDTGVSYPVVSPQRLVVGDFNGDTLQDVVVATYDASNLGIYLFNGKANSGDGKLLSDPVQFMNGHRAMDLQCADYNQDSYLDLAVASYMTGGGLRILYNNKAGGFGEPIEYNLYATGIEKFDSGDFNGDGIEELIYMANYGNGLAMRLNTGNTFLPQKIFSLPGAAFICGAADINNDNKLDAVVFDSAGNIDVLEGNGDGTFQPCVTYATKPGAYARSIVFGDFDNDGALDVMVGDQNLNEFVLLKNKILDVFSNVQLSASEQEAGTAKSLQATVTTVGVADGTGISASLRNADGSAVSPSITANATVASNGAVLDLQIPATLAAGNYKVTLQLNGKSYEAPYVIFSHGAIVWKQDTLQVDENAGTATLHFSRTGGNRGQAELSLELGGTAVLDTNYKRGSGATASVITLADGTDYTDVSVTFELFDDSVYIGNRTITVTLSSAPGAAIMPAGLPATATITIRDNELPAVTGVIDPNEVFGVVNGTAKTADALGLVTQTKILSQIGMHDTTITWDVAGSSYDPSLKTEQRFTVTGIVALPAELSNRNNVDLSVLGIVTVDAAVPVTGVALDHSTMSLEADGATGMLVATVDPGNASNKAVLWSSSNTEFATVADGVITPIAVGTTTITATTVDGSKTATCVVTVNPMPVAGVTLDQSTMSLESYGTTGTLIATVNPGNATNKKVTWSTSNTAVATVVNGVVTPVAVGTVTITVTSEDGNKTAACVVTVNPKPVTAVTLDKGTMSLESYGTTGTLTATVNPGNATNKNIIWSTSDIAVATVANGVITPLAAGTATITVKTEDGNKTAICVITVNPKPVTGVTLDKGTMSLESNGATGTLIATVNPGNATNKKVLWSSSNTAVATVVGGVVTPIAVGTATITGTTEDGNKTATCVVTVNPMSVTGVTLDKSTMYLVAQGVTGTLVATVNPTNAANKKVIWSSSNTTVATVAGGVVTPLRAGTTTITVRTEDGNKSATCTVTVDVSAAERAAAERAAAERAAAAEKLAAEKLAAEKAAVEKLAAEKLAAEKAAAEKAAAEKLAAEKAAAEKAAAEKAAAEKAAAEKLAAEKLAAEKVAAEKLAAEKAAAEKAAAEKVAAEKQAAEKAAAEKLAAERAAANKTAAKVAAAKKAAAEAAKKAVEEKKILKALTEQEKTPLGAAQATTAAKKATIEYEKAKKVLIEKTALAKKAVEKAAKSNSLALKKAAAKAIAEKNVAEKLVAAKKLAAEKAALRAQVIKKAVTAKKN